MTHPDDDDFDDLSPSPPLAALGIHDDEPYPGGPITVTVRLAARLRDDLMTVRRTVGVEAEHNAVDSRREALLAAALVLLRDLGGLR